MKSIQLLSHENVEGLRVGLFKGRINTTCILYRIGSTIIDTGPPNQWSTVKNFLLEREVKNVLITHYHEDHSGNAAKINNEMNAKVFADQNGIHKHLNGFKMYPYEYLIWGKPQKFKPDVLNQIDYFEEGNLKLKAIYSPGHSEDMTVFLEPDKGWLFTGDLFISHKPVYMKNDENPLIEMESMKNLLNYDFDTVFCSHRGIIPNGKKSIQQKLNYYEELKYKINELHNQGKSIKEITYLLFGKETFMKVFTMNHFSKENIVKLFLNK